MADSIRRRSRPEESIRFRSAPRCREHLDLDTQVADCALQLGVPEQELDSAQILRLAIDEPPHRVRAIGVTVKANFLDPAVNDTGVLPSSKVWRCMHSTREDVVVASQLGHLDPSADGFARSSGDLELHTGVRQFEAKIG